MCQGWDCTEAGWICSAVVAAGEARVETERYRLLVELRTSLDNGAERVAHFKHLLRHFFKTQHVIKQVVSI